ncbi:MAG: hypothetical protein E7242_10630 [Lachnospiraceae bacterium]|nr:hypothetical protein [Lachnospiraceae bacterium]
MNEKNYFRDKNGNIIGTIDEKNNIRNKKGKIIGTIEPDVITLWGIIKVVGIIIFIIVFVLCAIKLINKANKDKTDSNPLTEVTTNVTEAPETTETTVFDPNAGYTSTEETVFDNGVIYCVVQTESDISLMGHKTVFNDYHTYDKKTNKELNLIDVTGKSEIELTNEIREKLREKYPQIYDSSWGKKNSSENKYYESIKTEDLQFEINDDGSVEVYDGWGLGNDWDVAPTVHVTLDSLYN